MAGPEQPPRLSVSPTCPDLLQHVEGSSPPPPPRSPFYRSFFEEECRAIVSRLLRDSAAEPAPHRQRDSPPWPGPAPPATSTPLWGPSGAAAAAPPDPAPAEPRRLQPPGTGAHHPARRAARSRATPGLGRARTPRRSPGRGRAVRAGAELPAAERRLGAPGTKLPQPRGSKLKVTPSTSSRLPRSSGALQPAQLSTVPKSKAQDAQTESAARAGGRRLPSQRLSTAIPTVASDSRLRLLGKVPSPKRFCFGKADQTWELERSSFSNKLAPGHAVPAEQSAGDQLSQELKCLKDEPECAKREWEQVTSKMEQVTNELKHAKKEWEKVTNELEHVKSELKYVKNELELVKNELADKTAQCEAYHRTILQAQHRATGICPEDAAVEKGGDLGTDTQQMLVQIPEPLCQ
ncbi:putative uncharacterized protein ENSP00000383309 [Phaenicophaeus curvirostris]|uniref:putative uncharacterized protein ENSP00000383309 n=1 Tax=Phaenicophaeus curvirostris TaxID=33595 RepID=UPI0037F0FFB3